MKDDIMVSICCLVYNHEKYLRKCLDGFLMQKTNFKYEILIHDDASTDKSQEIIREYEEKYPDVIKPIYQTENQYSQRKPISPKHQWPRAKGKYIAECEGDDFWTDPYKLQKQFDALESNPDCHMCICKVKGVYEDESLTNISFPNFDISSGVYKPSEIMDLICTNDYVFQTSSYFMVKEDILYYGNNRPTFSTVAAAGDTAHLLYFCTLGNFYYISDEMSCYRLGSISSQERKKKYAKTEEQLVAWYNKQIRMMEEYDKYTNGKYHDLCQRKIDGYHFDRAVRNNNYKEMLKPKYRFFIKDYSFKAKVKLFLMACFSIVKKR